MYTEIVMVGSTLAPAGKLGLDNGRFHFSGVYFSFSGVLTQDVSSLLKVVGESRVFKHQEGGCGLRLM